MNVLKATCFSMSIRHSSVPWEVFNHETPHSNLLVNVKEWGRRVSSPLMRQPSIGPSPVP